MKCSQMISIIQLNFDILFNACKFNCIPIVKILMNNNKEDINKTIKVKPDEILTEIII